MSVASEQETVDIRQAGAGSMTCLLTMHGLPYGPSIASLERNNCQSIL